METFVSKLREGAETLLGYIDNSIQKSEREITASRIRKVWSASFGERYGFYPYISGARVNRAYIRTFDMGDKSAEIIERMTPEGNTDCVYLKLDSWPNQLELKTFIEAEEKVARYLKPQETEEE